MCCTLKALYMSSEPFDKYYPRLEGRAILQNAGACSLDNKVHSHKGLGIFSSISSINLNVAHCNSTKRRPSVARVSKYEIKAEFEKRYLYYRAVIRL